MHLQLPHQLQRGSIRADLSTFHNSTVPENRTYRRAVRRSQTLDSRVQNERNERTRSGSASAVRGRLSSGTGVMMVSSTNDS